MNQHKYQNLSAEDRARYDAQQAAIDAQKPAPPSELSDERILMLWYKTISTERNYVIPFARAVLAEGRNG